MEPTQPQEEQPKSITGDEHLLRCVNATESSIKNLLKAIASYGTPEQSFFASQLWMQLTDFKEAHQEYMEVKRLTGEEE
jgi:uncharacterized protein YcgI (DUF1989 family)